MLNNRYNGTNNTKKSNTGANVYTSILYPEMKPSDNDLYVFSKQGDRLDLLAYKYYKDSKLWWIIAHANKIKGTFIVPLDIQIRIPMNLTEIDNNLRILNK